MKDKTYFSNNKNNSPKAQAKAAKLKSIRRKKHFKQFSILNHDDFLKLKIADFLQP